MTASAKNKVRFHYLSNSFSFIHRNAVKVFLLRQLRIEGKKVEEINYIFCSDAYLLAINKRYLKHDTFTDIITFELSDKDMPLLADVYISVERVRENARLYSTRFDEELHRVIFHGALHLAGYTDKKKAEAGLMRLKEIEWLSAYFVSRGIGRLKINRFPVKR